MSQFQVMTPEGDGINNELIIYRGQQESEIYYFNYTAPSFTGPGTESSPNNGYVFPLRAVTVADRISYTGNFKVINQREKVNELISIG